MFYRLLHQYARLAIRIYCPRIVINRPAVLHAEGPLLLAANHPNSFLDGIILTTLFDHPVHSLARGDVFRHPKIEKLLRWMRLLPVYRTSEGVHNLEHNYTTFEACRKTFGQKGIVLIFSEGRSENEWHLRPLKKGTARLALTSWQQGIPLQVVPLAFNYSSFKKYGKELHLYFGAPLEKEIVDGLPNEGKKLLAFNEALDAQLHNMVYEIGEHDENARRKRFPNIIKNKILLLLPALAGWLLHAVLFYPVRWATELCFRNSGHYDSVLHAALMLLYPFYLLLLLAALWPHLSWYALLVLLIAPLTARAWTKLVI